MSRYYTPRMPLPAPLARLALDCEITACRSAVPGGQNKTKTESSVRVRHLPSGITRIATESRSQARNRRLALEREQDELARRARRPKPRVATRPTAAATARRLESKRRASQKKRARQSAKED